MSAQEIVRFYPLMDGLKLSVGGFRRLKDCSGRDGWPPAGMYFFFDKGEPRGDGSGPRVVRVGTHGLASGAGSTLWGRLRQHRGSLAGGRPGGCNHRASVFRYHVGGATLARDGDPDVLLATWLARKVPRSEVADLEHETEVRVSEYIGDLPSLWLAVGDWSERGLLEPNWIPLLSSKDGEAHVLSTEWLGRHGQSRAIPSSGMWNVNHMGEVYDPRFFTILEQRIRMMR